MFFVSWRPRSKGRSPDYGNTAWMLSGSLFEQGVATDQDSVSIRLENNDHCSILELNVTLPYR